jgi:hypothetical protein
MNRTDTILSLTIDNNDIEGYIGNESMFQDASVIQYEDCSFIYNKNELFYHIVEGRSMGIDFPIKELDFIDMIRILDKKKINLIYYKYYDVENTIIQNLSIELNYTKRIDYTGILNHLEKNNMINVKESKSFLATDNRVFSFIGEDDTWIEFDIIGTPCGKKYTNRLMKLLHIENEDDFSQ